MRKVTKRDCSGCYNNFYNGDGAKECWSFKGATLEKKLDIHVDQMPPYKGMKPTLRPSCYKAQRWVRVDVSAIAKDGYWAR
jgi:hypothetical protein